MTLVVRAFPVNCKRDAVDHFASEVRQRADEARRFYSNFSVRRESWFFQDSVHCAMVIGVTEIGANVREMAKEFATTEDEFASWFKNRVYELSGVDENEQPLGPPTQLVFDSSGVPLPEGVAISARIYPVTSRQALDEFIGELRERSAETRAFYESFDVPREVWFFQETAHGPVVIGVTAMKAPERTPEYAETNEEFAAWFKRRVLEVTGVDPNKTPLGPASEEVFNFEA
jgi:hypothetical protein